MTKLKKTIALISAAAMCCSLAACGDAQNGEDSESAAETSAVSVSDAASNDDGIKAVFGEIRTEYNTDLDLSDYPLTKSDVPADFSLTVEAESGKLEGNAKANDFPDASGGAYVNGVNVEGDALTMTADIEYSGFYDMNFLTMGSEGRVNNVLVDGMKVGDITTNSPAEFGDTLLSYIYLDKGTHEITITPSWGYVDIDCLILTAAATPITEDTYKVEPTLVNPNADENTKRLYKFLCDIYGKYSLAGQYADEGRASSEYEKITAKTGKTFAVLGLDMGNYSLGSKAHGAESKTVEYAYDWYKNAGGIVQLCWHWTTPEDYAVNSGDQPWYSSFYKEGSKLDLDKIMNGEDDAAYQLLMDDIDNMANELARLRDAGVPVLWRPLHEAAGGWFWWGNCEPESYKKLWNVMYDKMTNEHNLTNLIWVWNGQDPAWYPGDETVDINGWDIYAGNHVDSSQSGRFDDMATNYGTKTKLIALTENGCVMDPDKVFNDNARWLFWGTWSDPFTMKLGVVINDEYTTVELLTKAYNHERVLTLDELPDLQNYPLD
ncbi:Mannan endo-1%2C4-beta-mannosidase [uncultured Ruminococcus sp.]|jgi:mannan endo-1,4-beta-mannosidase|uniref:glycosyl hydrolase n=1 Tax=Huintestinicola butyrica TaxID=2981728 RepID=UPI000820C298|nr:glycosyl hydrolase [Huintestinicola butyrica]MCU6727676.1 glycosyl hydrolase [Huintestinicola butyrica]SCI90307.1 Mannan endo-1%2C4-beta-mannosidase [uncultured Ruminococcus sp.]